MIERVAFYNMARANPFGGSLTQSQVDGTNVLLDAWDGQSEMTDLRWLAYMLATAKWETNSTMQPVREAYYLGEPEPAESYRKRLRYYPFYGRGLVQLTWEDNYRKMSPLVGVDLVEEPDQALNPKTSALIMFEGMRAGLFTGAGLPIYFNGNIEAPIAARQIINGHDRAEDVAEIYKAFLAAVRQAQT